MYQKFPSTKLLELLEEAFLKVSTQTNHNSMRRDEKCDEKISFEKNEFKKKCSYF